LPSLFGPADYQRLIVGWGSTAPAVIAALEQLQPEATAFLHCLQLYPVPQAVIKHLRQATQIIVIENNATGQFARLLRAEVGCSIDKEWHKYNGLTFTADEVTLLLSKELGL
jgi:2-oxoglutarate ferredoxin oxidoreductase subunit alpha